MPAGVRRDIRHYFTALTVSREAGETGSTSLDVAPVTMFPKPTHAGTSFANFQKREDLGTTTVAMAGARPAGRLSRVRHCRICAQLAHHARSTRPRWSRARHGWPILRAMNDDRLGWLLPPELFGAELEQLDPADADDRHLLLVADHPDLAPAVEEGGTKSSSKA